MVSNRSHGRIVAVAIAVVLASVLAPSVLAQQAGQSEQEPNDSPQNATFVQPGTQMSGEITDSENASTADADWYAFPVQQGQNVTVTFESGNDSERLLVFLASPNGSQNVSAVNDTLADATIAPSGSTVQLSASAEQSRIYFVGVTGLSGSYEFTVETSGSGMGMNGTNTSNASGMANASGTTQTTQTTTAETTTDTTTTTESTSTTTAGGSGGNDGGGGGGGEGTSTSGPGFGLLVAVVALLAAALLAVRRR